MALKLIERVRNKARGKDVASSPVIKGNKVPVEKQKQIQKEKKEKEKEEKKKALDEAQALRLEREAKLLETAKNREKREQARAEREEVRFQMEKKRMEVFEYKTDTMIRQIENNLEREGKNITMETHYINDKPQKIPVFFRRDDKETEGEAKIRIGKEYGVKKEAFTNFVNKWNKPSGQSGKAKEKKCERGDQLEDKKKKKGKKKNFQQNPIQYTYETPKQLDEKIALAELKIRSEQKESLKPSKDEAKQMLNNLGLPFA